MAQEFTINSSAIESKINQLLPSQGGFGAGVDFSASTMVIPIVDLTESAEGSNLRQDLQTALSLDQVTAFSVNNTTTTIINTTGFWRVFGGNELTSSGGSIEFLFDDTSTTKRIFRIESTSNSNRAFDFIVKMTPGDQLKVISSNSSCTSNGVVKQIASIDGVLSD